MSVSNRLFRLLKSVTFDKADLFEDMIDQGETMIDEKLKNWERKYGLNEEKEDSDEFSYDSWQKADDGSKSEKKPNVYPDKLSEDLALFGLKPPVTLDQVKKARNREMKKFHPDRFQQEPEKQETAKQIIQIYNAAFERIKVEMSEGE